MRRVSVTCIQCPMGCAMEVVLEDDGNVQDVEGNTCGRGKRYAQSEATNPTRMVTGTLCVPGAMEPLSYKTSEPVPKAKVREVSVAAQSLSPHLPVSIGDVLCEDVCGTGISIVATKNIG